MADKIAAAASVFCGYGFTDRTSKIGRGVKNVTCTLGQIDAMVDFNEPPDHGGEAIFRMSEGSLTALKKAAGPKSTGGRGRRVWRRDSASPGRTPRALAAGAQGGAAAGKWRRKGLISLNQRREIQWPRSFPAPMEGARPAPSGGETPPRRGGRRAPRRPARRR